jgi:hypothetical protein
MALSQGSSSAGPYPAPDKTTLLDLERIGQGFFSVGGIFAA